MAARGWRNWKLGVHRSEQNIDNFDTKSDKETQSPKLQLFKDIMRRETTKTEQQILLNEAERNSKKRKNRSLGRSSKTTPEKKDSKNHGLDQRVVVSQESVGLDSDSEAKSKICPLLNYCRPTYLGLACTAVAFLTLGTCGYIVACTFTPQTDIVMPSIDYLKKRSNLKHERNRKAGLSDFIGLNNVIGRRDWEDTHSKNDFVDLIESDYTDRDVDRFDNWVVKLDNQPNDKHLKDFYKRLLETDEQIKKLKMNLVNIPKTEDIDPKYQERHKRSTKLKLTGKIRRNRNQEKLDDQQNRSDIEKRESKEGKINVLTEKGRLKPINMYNRTNPLSIVMEKNQLIVQYKTDDEKRKLPKCTGSKAQKSHEENLKHPYHKNTERLDRILDQIIGSDMNYGDSVEQLFKKKKNKCKHPKINMEKNDKQKAHADHGDRNNDKTEESLEQMKKSDIIQGNELSNTDNNVFTDVTDSQEEDFPSQFEEMSMPSPYPFPDLTKTTTTEEYRVFMGMTTMMDPSKRENKHRSPNARKLLQVEEDEEKLDLSYDDLKEVLADRVEDHDDQDRHPEKREKRQYESYEFMQPATHAAPAREENKFNIYNKNWKGAMPLYPDELNVIMSQSGLPGYKKDYGNKIQDNRPESNLRDVEYIDDYVNKFEKVGKVAQAYSDYGVFDGSNSKGSVLDKTHATEVPDNINVNPRNIAGEKKVMNMNHEIANKATLDIKNNNRLSKVVLTAGRLKRSVATLSEHDAIDKIVAIADDIKKKNTEKLTKGKEGLSKPKGMKRNVEIEARGDKGNVKNDEENVNPIFGMIIGLLTSSASPIDQDSNRFSKNANATENFGRLSRTLMSYEENSENKTDSNSDNITDSSTRCPLGNSSISSVADSDSENATVIIIEASTITNKERNVKNERSIKNDTMVKRSVKVARNPMFWTDMYDEEYGSDGVPFDEDVAVNSKPKRSDPDKKSSSWIGKKMQRFSNNFRKKTTVGDFMEPPVGPHRVVKREYKTAPSNKKKETDGKINFKALHSNMKEVCKKAVREVQQANTKGVAVNTGETSQAASSLMQQLVQLMSDLVDYQVQQRTCRKLPPDLQEFLQWLTAPAAGEDKRKVDRHSGDQDASLDDMWKNYITNEAATEDPDASRKYEDMAHSIEDLSQEYEAMSSSDKEKLSGVKGHLEAQLKYLHDMMDDNRSKRNIEQVRFRNFQKPPENVSQDKNLREIRQKRTFMRNFGKKHTRSTASYYEGDVNERVTDEGETKDERRRRREEETMRRKKNLRDVYYKALSDARKLTTAKSDIEIVTSNFL